MRTCLSSLDQSRDFGPLMAAEAHRRGFYVAAWQAFPDDDPRLIVVRTLTYLRNNRSRMKYPEYRRQGLPLTSSLMESLIKEISWRVKGTEKFWNDPSGANPILALRAASLGDDNRLEKLLTE